MDKELKYLTDLISSILYEQELPKISKDFDYNNFVDLILKNGFTALVFEKTKSLCDMPKSLKDRLEVSFNKDIQRSIIQDYYSEQILNTFEREQIKCMALKGIELRNLYPEPYMRSMSDLDILIDVERLQATRKIMPELGFEVWQYDSHHDIYNIKPYLNVELHKMLIVGEMEDYFQIGFERAHLKEGCEYTYQMTIEDFYIHMIGHMAYHFAHGGVGIRLVLDVRIYLDKYGEQLNRKYLNEELDKVGLTTFAQHIEKLSEIWFLDTPSEEFFEQLGDFIVKSGYLGIEKHKEILEIVKNIENEPLKSSKSKAIIEVIFPSYKTMSFLYPVIKKVPILYPFTWVVRWLNVIFTRRENIKRITRLSNMEDEEIQCINLMYEKLKMKHLI